MKVLIIHKTILILIIPVGLILQNKEQNCGQNKFLEETVTQNLVLIGLLRMLTLDGLLPQVLI